MRIDGVTLTDGGERILFDSTPSTTTVVKDIPIQLENLGNLLEELNKKVHELEDGLRPVIGPDLVTKDITGEANEQKIAPLAEVLRKYCKQVVSIIDLTDSVRSRLQI